MKLPKDWSDVLSPVVVKEVRQGIRAKVFVAAFLITQMLMVFSVFLSLVPDGADAGFSMGFFWFLVGLPLLVIMPARGLMAVGSEIRDDTIDLVFLSRLSAWRIVVGKWAAIVAQTLLLVSSFLPYFVLRYFVGSVNLLQDLLALGIVLGASMLLTAGTVGMSALQPRGKKSGSPVILVVLGLFLASMLVPPLIMAMVQLVSGGMGVNIYGEVYACLALLGPILVIFFLQFGASRIAPPAENHALRKRLTAVVALLLCLALSAGDVARPFPFFFAAVIIAVTVIDAVSERVPRIYSIFLPFAKRGVPGRLVGRLLYPGWASGVVFSLAVISAMFVWALLHPDFQGDVEPHAYVVIIGIVFLPVALIRLVRPNTERPLPAYFAIQAIIAVVTSGAMILSEVTDSKALNALMSVVPLGYAIVSGVGVDYFEEVFTIGGSALTAVAMLVLLWRSRQSFREIDDLVAEVSQHSEAKEKEPLPEVEEMTALPAQELTAPQETATVPPPLPPSTTDLEETEAAPKPPSDGANEAQQMPRSE